MIKTENHLAEKCQGCPCFEATMHRDDIYADRTIPVTIVSVDCSNRILCDSIERHLIKEERRNKTCGQ